MTHITIPHCRVPIAFKIITSIAERGHKNRWFLRRQQRSLSRPAAKTTLSVQGSTLMIGSAQQSTMTKCWLSECAPLSSRAVVPKTLPYLVRLVKPWRWIWLSIQVMFAYIPSKQNAVFLHSSLRPLPMTGPRSIFTPSIMMIKTSNKVRSKLDLQHQLLPFHLLKLKWAMRWTQSVAII